jgi:hypothetical protein
MQPLALHACIERQPDRRLCQRIALAAARLVAQRKET